MAAKYNYTIFLHVFKPSRFQTTITELETKSRLTLASVVNDSFTSVHTIVNASYLPPLFLVGRTRTKDTDRLKLMSRKCIPFNSTSRLILIWWFDKNILYCFIVSKSLLLPYIIKTYFSFSLCDFILLCPTLRKRKLHNLCQHYLSAQIVELEYTWQPKKAICKIWRHQKYLSNFRDSFVVYFEKFPDDVPYHFWNLLYKNLQWRFAGDAITFFLKIY